MLKEDEISLSSQDEEYWNKVIEVMTKLEKETQNETRGPVKKMETKDPSMPNFTLLPNSQSTMFEDVKPNLECATAQKEPEIKKRPTNKAK